MSNRVNRVNIGSLTLDCGYAINFGRQTNIWFQT